MAVTAASETDPLLVVGGRDGERAAAVATGPSSRNEAAGWASNKKQVGLIILLAALMAVAGLIKGT